MPQFVVLFGPGLVDKTGFHAFVSAFDADRAHVDMTDQRHQRHHGGHRVDHVRDLHVAAHITQARYQFVQHEATAHQHQAREAHAPPEHAFFTRVETVRRHLVVTHHATGFFQPVEIGSIGDVVLQKGEHQHQQRHGKQRADKVVHVLQHIRQPAEQGTADDRENEELAERHHNARHRQGHKRTRVGPVRRTLERREPLDLATRVSNVPTQRPFGLVENAHRNQHDQQQRAAIGQDPVVAHLPPGFTRIRQAAAGVLHKRLDQVARLGCLRDGQAAEAGDPTPHLPPHGRVVAGLHLGAFGIGLPGVARLFAGLGFDIENIGTLHAPCGRRIGSPGTPGGTQRQRSGHEPLHDGSVHVEHPASVGGTGVVVHAVLGTGLELLRPGSLVTRFPATLAEDGRIGTRHRRGIALCAGQPAVGLWTLAASGQQSHRASEAQGCEGHTFHDALPSLAGLPAVCEP